MPLCARKASADDDEIEVTPEMVEAGALALLGFDPDFNDDETAVRVYRAMEAVRRARDAEGGSAAEE